MTMRVHDCPPEIKAMFKKFTEQTGIEFRYLNNDIIRQAAEFLTTFTLDELELVLRWIKWMIRTDQGGFNVASLGWRKLFGDYGSGDMFQTFQERLGLAQEAQKRGSFKPGQVHTVAEAKAAKQETKPPTEEEQRLRDQASEGFKNFKL